MAMAMKLLSSTVALCFGASVAFAEPAIYPTPEAATEAFVAALIAKDRPALLTIFGPEADDLIGTDDPEQDAEARKEFLAEYNTFHQIVPAGDNRVELEIGRSLWAFPVAMIKSDAGWTFDVAGARDEILARRIGMNELDVIEVFRRAIAVQAAFRETDYDGDGVMEFASSIVSTPGKRDGLYWPPEEGTPDSPIGAFMAQAAADGVSIDGVDQAPVPYLGYFFRILTRQGEAAPGGAYDYMVEGNMVAGHALLAYPAEPGDSGIMSFMMGENGQIYEANLGDKTLEVAGAIDSFNPTEGWKLLTAE
ncbi:DUF2950 domain-containing protein [Tabrizicola sp. BL-A-41-H6]|uniref:DUF2950 domain-containing protein n=1 Tax=Tabrizicola sp. BL-A-41-H6 TaxID=3421107 RepID=UPI003D66EC82